MIIRKMLEVFFGQKPVRNNEVISLEQAQEPLEVEFRGDPNKLYTILFYDSDSVHGPYVHYEVVNSPGGNTSLGDITFSYQSPNPAPKSGMHRYNVIVFEQGRERFGELNTSGRASIPLEAYMRSLELTPVAEVTVQVPSPGTFLGPMTRARTRQAQISGYSNCGCGNKRKVHGYSNEPDWVDQEAVPNKNDRAYCRCVLKVAGKQSGAYNPYAVCHASVKGESGRPECGPNYIFENIPDAELVGYAGLNRIDIPYPYNRQTMLDNINKWKSHKY